MSPYCYSYSIMQECWNDNKDSRPTFHELKEKFDDFISYEERYTYLPLCSALADLEESIVLAEEGPGPAEDDLEGSSSWPSREKPWCN